MTTLNCFLDNQETLTALQHLWSSGCLPKLSSRICDSVILILCHLIRGEKMIRDKLMEEKRDSEDKKMTSSAAFTSNSQWRHATDVIVYLINNFFPAAPNATFTSDAPSE